MALQIWSCSYDVLNVSVVELARLQDAKTERVPIFSIAGSFLISRGKWEAQYHDKISSSSLNAHEFSHAKHCTLDSTHLMYFRSSMTLTRIYHFDIPDCWGGWCRFIWIWSTLSRCIIWYVFFRRGGWLRWRGIIYDISKVLAWRSCNWVKVRLLWSNGLVSFGLAIL